MLVAPQQVDQAVVEPGDQQQHPAGLVLGPGALLLAADAVIRSELGSLSATDEPMPADVVARLERLLLAVPPAADRTVVQFDEARRHRRRFMIALSTAAAIVAVGFASIVVVPLLAGGPVRTMSSGPDAAAPAVGKVPPGDIVLLTTGTDYRPETLGSVPVPYSAPTLRSGSRIKDQGAPNEGANATVATPLTATAVPPALARLTEPVSRAGCVAAIVAMYGGRVTLMDLARFQGEPAATVIVEGTALAGAGHTLVVVVGGGCGQDGGTPAELYHGVV